MRNADSCTGAALSRSLVVLVTSVLCASSTTLASDCNRNSVDDNLELHAPLEFMTASDFPTGMDSHSMDAADIDRDGDTDLVTVDLRDDKVTVLLNDGAGSFGASKKFVVGNHPRGVVAADLNGDGWIDIAAHNENEDADSGPTVTILIHRGDGGVSFHPHVEIPSVSGVVSHGFARTVEAADLDGDGALDLVFGFQNAPQTSFVLNDARGWFSEPVVLPDRFHTGFIATGTIDPGPTIDLAGSAGSRHLNRGAAVFSDAEYQGLIDYRTATGCALADIDGDGDLDLVSAEFVEEGRIHVLVNHRGSFSSRMAPVAVGDRPEHLLAEDLDGDGHVDIAVANRYSNSVSIIRNLGAGQLVVESVLEVATQPRWIVAGDFNGDELTDLATAGYRGKVSVLLRVPTSRSRDRNLNGVPDECEFHRGDPNGDGVSNLEDPTFILNGLFRGGPRSTCAESADVNDDGVRDIADVVYLILFLYAGGPPPGPPGLPGDARSTRDVGAEPFLGCER